MNQIPANLKLRVRRGRTFPAFVQEELNAQRRYARTLSPGGNAVRLRYRRSAWSTVGCANTEALKNRDLFAWLLDSSAAKVGALHLVEYSANSYLNNDDIFEVMDSSSQTQCELGEIICEHWCDFYDDVLGVGNVVEFRNAWTDPHKCPPAIWANAAEALIVAEAPDHALLIMKAFPLEYNGLGKGRDSFLLARQNAMIRYYKRLFNVAEFAEEGDSRGWLFRINQARTKEVEPPFVT